MKKVVPIFLIAVIAAIAIAIKFLPWWALLLGVLALIIIGKFVIKRLFFRLLLKPFQLKGAVLKGATAQVHSVTATTAPPPPQDAETEEEAEATDRSFYFLEVSIQPGGSDTPFGAWEPGELRLVAPESVLDMNPDTPGDDDDTCEIRTVEVQQEGEYKPDEGMKFPGPQRLRLLIAVKPGASRLKFRYYFEEFGSVVIPPSTAHIAEAA